MNVTLKQLKAFLAVARTGSFTLAAESLYITQAALSGLIKEFEKEVGVRLFDRSTRKVEITDVGQSMMPKVESILTDLEQLLAGVSKQKELESGVVRVAVSQLLAASLLPEIMGEFHAAHPGIELRLMDVPVEDVMSKVFAEEVDFGVGPERLPNSDIASIPLFEGPFMAVVPPAHPLAELDQVTWDDLGNYPIIALRGQFTEKLNYELRTLRPDQRLQPTYEVAFMSTALPMTTSGLGVTLCIPYAAGMVHRHGLVMKRIVDPEIFRSFDVFTVRHKTLSPAAEAFLEFMCLKLKTVPEIHYTGPEVH